MGHRLSKIVTRTGDAGTTGLGDGSRVAKDSPRIDAIGSVDELNSHDRRAARRRASRAPSRSCLVDVQHDLFDLGGELSIPGYERDDDAHVERLEADVERFNAELRAAQGIHPARRHARRRARARRAHRVPARRARAVHRGRATETRQRTARANYLNRLSDLLFVLARALNRAGGRPDVLWQKARADAA